MRLGNVLCGAAALCVAIGAASGAPKDNDPYLWLSDIHGAKPLAWVAQQNAKSEAVLKADPLYAADRDAILKSLDTKDRIALGRLDHDAIYNFWQDGDHVRGLWRRATLDEYRKPDPNWEILLDVDKLDADEKTPWVFQGANCAPGGERCLIRLSPGGGDAATIREFDLKTKAFVKDGFALPLAKLDATYMDADTVLVATDFGPGTITKSSYPRIVKLWKRGEALADAKTIFEATVDNIAARPVVFHGPYGTIAIIDRGLTFFASEFYFVAADGQTTKLPLPTGADIKGVTGSKLIFTLRDAWTPPGAKKPFPQGSLVAYSIQDAMSATAGQFALLYTPDKYGTIDSVSAGRDAVYASIYQNVTGSVHAFAPNADGTWSDVKLALPEGGSTTVVATNDWGPQAQFTFESFLVPPTLYEDTGDGKVAAIKSQAPLFDASGLAATQFWTTSKDGTKIPYFLIRAKSAKGPVPTILYSYGGFELSLTPWYWDDGHRPLDAGQAWLSKGGAIAVANIRGGGEFGPAWHQAALKAHRQRAFDDFAAVAMDLERRKLATPRGLGIVGASNGGVLTTVTMTQHPALLHAVVCQRPLIDMLRYTQFGAGASWVDEYGDPALARDRAWLAKYSAYQNVKAREKYPPVLFITETSDDRVTPVWARMMAAKMEAQHHDVLFNESAEGGHGPGSTNAAQADMWALSYVYLARELGLEK